MKTSQAARQGSTAASIICNFRRRAAPRRAEAIGSASMLGGVQARTVRKTPLMSSQADPSTSPAARRIAIGIGISMAAEPDEKGLSKGCSRAVFVDAMLGAGPQDTAQDATDGTSSSTKRYFWLIWSFSWAQKW
ncbi:hypothetical protein PG989_001786 [Apiospora arundinis]